MTPVLSIRQPWAWLVVHAYKPVENRTWPTTFRGPLAIHAGKTMARRYYDEIVDSLKADGLCPPDLPAFEELERGGIVGAVRVVDCVEVFDSPWKEPDSFGFILADARPFPFIPCVGRLGFFNVPESMLRLAYENGALQPVIARAVDA